jgi:hypothetical protein
MKYFVKSKIFERMKHVPEFTLYPAVIRQQDVQEKLSVSVVRNTKLGRCHPIYRPRRPLGRVEVYLYFVFRPRH